MGVSGKILNHNPVKNIQSGRGRADSFTNRGSRSKQPQASRVPTQHDINDNILYIIGVQFHRTTVNHNIVAG